MRSFRGSTTSECGSSLVEVTITVALLAVVLGVVFGAFGSTQRALTGAAVRLGNLDEARVLMAATSKDLRTAVRLRSGTSPFVSADATSVTFYANLDTTAAPKKVSIRVDASSQLVEQVWDADSGSQAPNYTFNGNPKVRFVGRYIANTVAQPVFTYLAADGSPLAASPLDAASLLAVKAVRITLYVRKATTQAMSATALVNRVRLPNLDYNAVAG